jgi:ribosomal protein S18 acetylase RimI-like enzyme
LRAATLSGDAEINEAIATLVLSFAADTVARWMYRPRITIFDIPSTVFARLERVRLKQVRCIARSTERESQFGFPRECTATLHLLKWSSHIIWLDIAVFEMTEHHRPSESHWYMSLIGVDPLHRNRGYGAALPRARSLSLRQGTPGGISLVFKKAKYVPLSKTRL